jgi:enoyl-CoA hydratase
MSAYDVAGSEPVSTEPPVLVEQHDGWRHLILNRPEKRNSLSQALLDALSDALLSADRDPVTHAVLLSGGTKSPDFCTGYFYEGQEVESLEEDIAAMERDQRRLQTIFDMHKPVIAKVHGRCFAGGTDLALMCDMVIAADDALFAFPPHRDFGHGPNDQWIYHCGPQWAKRLLFTGDTIDAVDAARIGLILKAVPAAALDREVEGLMQRLAQIDPALLAVHKRAVNLALELMGARTFQRLALELDARGHLAPHAIMVKERSRGAGSKDFNLRLKADRLEKFGPGRLRVTEPDPYDDAGRLQ